MAVFTRKISDIDHYEPTILTPASEDIVRRHTDEVYDKPDSTSVKDDGTGCNSSTDSSLFMNVIYSSVNIAAEHVPELLQLAQYDQLEWLVDSLVAGIRYCI